MSTTSDPICLMDSRGVHFTLIRRPAQSAEYIVGPANELRHYITKSLQSPIPEWDAAQPIQLVLHLDYTSNLGQEEFEIQAVPTQITLRAKTEQGMYHAVYSFLEKALDIRWLWPGEHGEVVPKHQSWYYPIGKIREKPDYAWRAIHVGGAIHEAIDYETALHSIMQVPMDVRKQFHDWCRRNRFGGLNIADGHRWSEIAPAEQYGEQSPHLYALVDGQRDCIPLDGKHGNQPCLTHPDTIELMAAYAADRFMAEPSLDAFSLALNDGGHSCECEACLAFDKEAGSEHVIAIEHMDAVTREGPETRNEIRSVTDRVIWNANEVAKKLNKRFPDKKLLTMFYSHYRRPPVKYKLDKQIIGQFCLMGHSFWNDDIRQIELTRLQEMGQYVPQLGIYEYYANGAWPEIHRLFPQLVAETVREYYAAGARYFATQPTEGFAINGANLYVLGKVLWNTSTNGDNIVNDFCEHGFGPAAAVIRSYLKAFEERWRETKSGQNLPRTPEPRIACASLYPPEFIAQRQQQLDQAKQLAAQHSDVLNRIRFIEIGLEYTRLYCEAVAALGDLYRETGCVNLNELKQVHLTREVITPVLGKWKSYWAFVQLHQAKFIFGDFWVHYRPGMWGSKDATLHLLNERLANFQADQPADSVIR